MPNYQVMRIMRTHTLSVIQHRLKINPVKRMIKPMTRRMVNVKMSSNTDTVTTRSENHLSAPQPPEGKEESFKPSSSKMYKEEDNAIYPPQLSPDDELAN